jgi:hypothetical protein
VRGETIGQCGEALVEQIVAALSASGFRLQGLGFRIQGSGFRV